MSDEEDYDIGELDNVEEMRLYDTSKDRSAGWSATYTAAADYRPPATLSPRNDNNTSTHSKRSFDPDTDIPGMMSAEAHPLSPGTGRLDGADMSEMDGIREMHLFSPTSEGNFDHSDSLAQEAKNIRLMNLFSPTSEGTGGGYDDYDNSHTSGTFNVDAAPDVDGDKAIFLARLLMPRFEAGIALSPAAKRWKNAILKVRLGVRFAAANRRGAMATGVTRAEKFARELLEKRLMFELNHLHHQYEAPIQFREALERYLLVDHFRKTMPAIGKKERGNFNLHVNAKQKISIDDEGHSEDSASYFKVYQGTEEHPLSHKSLEGFNEFAMFLEDPATPITVETHRLGAVEDKFMGKFQILPCDLPRHGEGEMTVTFRWDFVPTSQRPKRNRDHEQYLKSFTYRKEMVVLEQRQALSRLMEEQRLGFRGILTAMEMEEAFLSLESKRRHTQAQFWLLTEEREARTALYLEWKTSREVFLELGDRTTIEKEESDGMAEVVRLMKAHMLQHGGFRQLIAETDTLLRTPLPPPKRQLLFPSASVGSSAASPGGSFVQSQSASPQLRALPLEALVDARTPLRKKKIQRLPLAVGTGSRQESEDGRPLPMSPSPPPSEPSSYCSARRMVGRSDNASGTQGDKGLAPGPLQRKPLVAPGSPLMATTRHSQLGFGLADDPFPIPLAQQQSVGGATPLGASAVMDEDSRVPSLPRISLKKSDSTLQ